LERNNLKSPAPEVVSAPEPAEQTFLDSSPLSERTKAMDVLEAIRLLKHLEKTGTSPSDKERETLRKFGGFGAVALSIFPDPVTREYKSPAWQDLGLQLKALLTDDEYASAKRTTFTAFYTSPMVVSCMYDAFERLGVPRSGTVLEPGCGCGNFMAQAPQAMRFVGVELDAISGRVARALYPNSDIRIENFRDTRLPEGRFDAAIGNPPFGDVKFEYGNMKLSLHDYFITKSLDSLKPGGILAMVTSHYTLDKRNAEMREYLARKADFMGAIRLPSDAFKHEGTKVVTDIIFLRKRLPSDTTNPESLDWLDVGTKLVEGAEVAVNKYFLNRPEMVLGTWSRKNTLYGGQEGFSIVSSGSLALQLPSAVRKLPRLEYVPPVASPAQQSPASVTPAPAAKPAVSQEHIGEGSFLVGPDQSILQVVAGDAMPVTYGGTQLKANGTMVGRRLANLVELRDHARRVLQSQNEGWPERDREEARRSLNQCYDRFVRGYGPINKTTLSETSSGLTIRRMPNLVKFREDPDAMLVMSLECYNESTHKATRAAIMSRDVVGRTPAVTAVSTAEEGLLVSLNDRGTVDLTYIESLYGKSETTIIRELGDLIFRNPETEDWETSDQYLSGNVRAKLAVAQRSGVEYQRNIDALLRVQPEDVLPGDIDANLGAPWIPEDDIGEFAAYLFNVPRENVRVGHLKKDALWSFETDYLVERSVAAGSDYGTTRANGVSLFELALNLRTPVIYDTISTPNGDSRVVNQEETLAAREKQKLIKEKFRSWVFADPDRTERLVRIYNDTYNNLRPRLFDGSHLDFPGMNSTIQLNDHQKNAVWRCMSSGNTLLAHVVGAGKTFTMSTAGMKMKAAGLIQKPLYVVPNHMLEQFAREFMQLYPNARLLVATKDDLVRERRKALTAKIASGDWDGIILTHSSFERVAMSRDYQARFVRKQIEEYDQLLVESAQSKGRDSHRNLIKAIEKQKARREARLTELLAEEKKDDGLVFDELGVDQLFIDEAHYFKNLETPTKMERVAGIQTGGSERAFDLFMKARFLHEQNPGRGVVFATGTPISNTMVEMFTMQRYLDPHGLEERGLEHFDAWAATFGEVVDTVEISPDGSSLRPRSRFAKFINIPELQQMFRAFADVQTAEMLDLPRPSIAGGKPGVVPCPMSADQRQIQAGLVERYEKIRSQKVDPRVDNALAITTDGRKLALDARLVEGDAEDWPYSKVNAAIESIYRIWHETRLTRKTQIVFCDMGVHPTAWGFSTYDEITTKLVRMGVPRSEIAAIGDADTDAKTQALFDKVRSGSVRVLIGSTQKMGTGTNVQKRLIALHHLDAPWKPAEVEQREGRILRQGNENKEIQIFRYVTEGSFDAYMWQALETKARFISQVMTGDALVRSAEDIGGQELSYAEVKAISSGNPAVLTLAETDAELQRLAVLRKNHSDAQFLARRKVRDLPDSLKQLSDQIAKLTKDLEFFQSSASSRFVVGEVSCPRELMPQRIADRLESLPKSVYESRKMPLGFYQGMTFGVIMHPQYPLDVYLEGAGLQMANLSREHQGPRAIFNAVERLVANMPAKLAKLAQDRDAMENQLRDYQARLGKGFPLLEYQNELTELRDRLKLSLSSSGESKTENSPPAETSQEIAARIRLLRNSQQPGDTAEPVRSVPKQVIAEIPVSARIRNRVAEQSCDSLRNE
jgi:N12 class adenine-specific DNA methylase